MQAITVDGVTHHVRVEGPEDGPALVLANSLGTDLRIWDAMLAHVPAGLRIVRYDKRGHGLSDCPEGYWRVETLAADLAGIMDALGVSAATVCGLSVGGMIAQALAASRPDLVRALVLADTAARIGPEEMWTTRIAAVEADGLAPLADGVMDRWFTHRFRAGDPSLPLWRNMLMRTPAAGYAATCAAIRDADLTASTAALRLPCLAVCGAEDVATTPELVLATAALIPGSRFEKVPEAGHLPPVEQPAVLGRLVADFLAEAGLV